MQWNLSVMAKPIMTILLMQTTYSTDSTEPPIIQTNAHKKSLNFCFVKVVTIDTTNKDEIPVFSLSSYVLTTVWTPKVDLCLLRQSTVCEVHVKDP